MSIILVSIISACSNVSVDISYEPPVIPIEISLNQRGEVQIRASAGVVTPLGKISVGAQIPIRPDKVFLVIRNSNQSSSDEVYHIPKGSTVKVKIEGEVKQVIDSSGNVIIDIVSGNITISPELEQVASNVIQPSTSPYVATVTSAPSIGGNSSISLVGYVSASRLNIRVGPGIEYNQVSTLSKNDRVIIIGRNEDFTWVELNNPHRGWVNKTYLVGLSNEDISRLPVTYFEKGCWGPAQPSTNVRGVVQAETLRIRGGPGKDYKQLSNPDTVKPGETLNIVGISSDGRWYLINISNKSGWVRANSDYVKIVSGSPRNLPVMGAYTC